MRKEKREKLLVRLAGMIDAHSGNWNELCELQELVKELRSRIYNEQSIRQDERDEIYRRLVAESQNYGKGDYVSMGDICCLFAELRQEGKQEQP